MYAFIRKLVQYSPNFSIYLFVMCNFYFLKIEQWTPITPINDGFREDKNGNVVIRVMCNAEAKYNEVFGKFSIIT